MYDFVFRMAQKPQFMQKGFEIVAISSKKPPIYAKKDEHDQISRSKLYEKELIKIN